MAQKSVVWTNIASRQKRLILEYWVNRIGNAKYSIKLNQQIESKIKIIQKNPEMSIKTSIEGVRTVTLGNYNIFYSYNSIEIVILAFWDNRQNPEKLVSSILEKQ